MKTIIILLLWGICIISTFGQPLTLTDSVKCEIRVDSLLIKIIKLTPDPSTKMVIYALLGSKLLGTTKEMGFYLAPFVKIQMENINSEKEKLLKEINDLIRRRSI